MTNELMNMQDLKEKITENIKLNFFNLIPDDKFQKLVDDEIKAFFEVTSKEFKIISTSYINRETDLTMQISPFRALVWEECKKIVFDKIQKYFQEDDFQIGQEWDGENYKMLLSEKFEKILEEKANKLAANFFKDMFTMALEQSIPEIIERTKNSITHGY